VITDLQCCGDTPESWQEFRRRVEAREIRRLIRQVLERTHVDGIVFAGDFNLVNGSFALSLLTGPYRPPDAGLIPAELYHSDGSSTWTWDGRETPFPSGTLDFQLYSPRSLEMHSGYILDTESPRTGRHRPLVAEYAWRSE
jgi:hypothetical protein